jgi:hypothetical protein
MLSSESGLRGRLVVWLATQQELQARAALDETSNRKVAAKQQLKTLQATLTARLATLTSTLELTREKMGVVRGKLRREEAEEAPHAMADEWTGALEAHALSMHILQSESKDTQKALDSIDRALTSHQPEMKKSHHHRNSSAAHNFLNLPPNHRDRLAMRSQSCVEQHVLAVINECMATLDSVRTEEMEIHRRLQHAVSSREAVQSRKHANLVQDAQVSLIYMYVCSEQRSLCVNCRAIYSRVCVCFSCLTHSLSRGKFRGTRWSRSTSWNACVCTSGSGCASQRAWRAKAIALRAWMGKN